MAVCGLWRLLKTSNVFGTIQEFVSSFQLQIKANICNSIVLFYYLFVLISQGFLYSLMNNINRFAEENYIPSVQDLLSQPRKSAIREIAFKYEQIEYK